MVMTKERRLGFIGSSRQARGMEGRLAHAGSGRRHKGQMYSIIAVLLIIPVIVFVGYYITASQNMKFGAIDRVVADQQHQVCQMIENDFERAVTITGRRAVLAAVNNVIATGDYLDNSTLRLHELMANSSIYGSPSLIMANNTLSEWRSRMLSQDHSFAIDVNFSDPEIGNHDGLNIKISMFLTINVSDAQNRSRIDKTEWKEIIVPLEGIEDPVFPLSTTGSVKKVVKEYPFSYFTKKIEGTLNSGNCSGNSTSDPNDPAASSKILVVNNTTGIPDPVLQAFEGVVDEEAEDLGSRGVPCFVSGAAGAVQNISLGQAVQIDSLTASAWLLPINQGAEGTYYYRGIGPNFLQRMEGDLSESPDGRGMESFVPDEIGIPDKPSQTRIDYLFFSEQNYPGCRKARWIEGWLRLQPAEIGRYNLTELAYPVC